MPVQGVDLTTSAPKLIERRLRRGNETRAVQNPEASEDAPFPGVSGAAPGVLLVLTRAGITALIDQDQGHLTFVGRGMQRGIFLPLEWEYRQANVRRVG
jgi:hypothetical protein